MLFSITADQLSQWFKPTSRRAQELLPGLISRLINATAAVQGFRFPEGDAIRLHGPDGRTHVKTGNQFVPDGSALWEMGTGEGVGKKVGKDFAKRSRAVADATSDAYVAVTPHIWEDKAAWIAKKKRAESGAKYAPLMPLTFRRGWTWHLR